MGELSVALQVGDYEGTEFVQVTALVDTGATLTEIPASLLARLGYRPTERAEFEMADGTVIVRDTGEARVRLDYRERIVTVMFAQDDAEPVLGVTTLEMFRLGVDPVGQQLVRVRGRM